MTPLRQRYIDDLRLKNFSPGTIHVYVHAVAKFAQHFGRSPDTLTREEVRAYLVQLIDRGVSRSYTVLCRNALRHLYQDTLKRTDWLSGIPRPKRERRLPVVLSRDEVQRLFAVVTNLKQRALFMVAYDAGLRLSELINLRLEDIDSGRMVLRIRQGKGKKDRIHPEAVADLPAASVAPATPLPQPIVAPRLSIVVLPFANLSNEPEQQYFADGITEDVERVHRPTVSVHAYISNG